MAGQHSIAMEMISEKSYSFMSTSTEFGIRDNVPNTDGIRDIFFFGIRDIVLDI